MEEKKEKKKIPWWIIVIIIFLGILALSNNNEEYASCVDNCVSHNSLCVEYPQTYRGECSDNLKICINRCK
ncbi:MAG: hypothetical protein Q7R52_03600 [archaeon]|nr:hypothetical protein [archaeon]